MWVVLSQGQHVPSFTVPWQIVCDLRGENPNTNNESNQLRFLAGIGLVIPLFSWLSNFESLTSGWVNHNGQKGSTEGCEMVCFPKKKGKKNTERIE